MRIHAKKETPYVKEKGNDTYINTNTRTVEM